MESATLNAQGESPSLQLTAEGSSEKQDSWHVRASNLIVPYLIKNCSEFRRLSDLRQVGWNNPQGDVFFQRQRRNADECDERMAAQFYKIMKSIGEELHRSTGAFAVQYRNAEPPKILDMCMAPGGFLATALDRNPGSRTLAFSLPVSSGGHKVLLPKTSGVEQRFLDITMCNVDMGVETTPKDHPDADNFLPQQFEPHQGFDLVLCDGQVLRTHPRASYRETREARRLTTTQLALGLEHLNSGGTMIILLHKLEAWDTVNLVQQFHKFASVTLCKPRTSHAKRSSFYMIAANIQSKNPEAIKAIERWKLTWNVATFGSDEEYHKMVWDGPLNPEELLQDFGSKLVELGRDIWKVQADALAKAPFIRNRGGASVANV